MSFLLFSNKKGLKNKTIPRMKNIIYTGIITLLISGNVIGQKQLELFFQSGISRIDNATEIRVTELAGVSDFTFHPQLHLGGGARFQFANIGRFNHFVQAGYMQYGFEMRRVVERESYTWTRQENRAHVRQHNIMMGYGLSWNLVQVKQHTLAIRADYSTEIPMMEDGFSHRETVQYADGSVVTEKGYLHDEWFADWGGSLFHSFSGGISYSFHLNKKIVLNTGLLYRHTFETQEAFFNPGIKYGFRSVALSVGLGWKFGKKGDVQSKV